jgi:hypothetical protein
VAAFFTKWLVDLEDAQGPEGDFPDVAPRVVATGGGTAARADAGRSARGRSTRSTTTAGYSGSTMAACSDGSTTAAATARTSCGRPVKTAEGMESLRSEPGVQVFRVGPGEYHFAAPLIVARVSRSMAGD